MAQNAISVNNFLSTKTPTTPIHPFIVEIDSTSVTPRASSGHITTASLSTPQQPNSAVSAQLPTPLFHLIANLIASTINNLPDCSNLVH
jgi:hypothetical protein